MDDLVRWLGEQLDADEQTARAATDGPWIAEVSGETGNCVIPADAQSTREYVARTQLYHAAFDAEHIAEWDPARVLREIEMKRAVLQDLAEVIEASENYKGPDYYEGVDACERTLKRMASVYADRPGYREEWRP